VSAVWFAAFALAQFPVGLALDRLGPRRTVSGFMLFAVAGAAWFAGATHYAGALGAMTLIGIGCAPVLMGSLYLFGRVHPPARFAMLASAIIGIGSAGNLLGAAPLAWAVQAIGWRASMLAIAAVTAASCAVTFLLLRDPPPVKHAKEPSGFVPGIARIMRLRELWPLLPLVVVSYSVVIAIRSLWIGPYFGEVHGFDALQRGNAALAMAIAMSIGALAYGPVERLLGSPKMTVMAGSVLTALFLLALGEVDTPTMALVLLVGIGLTGMTYGILMAHARLFLPADLLGRGVTFVNALFIGGAGALQWISGSLVKAGQAAGAAPGATYGQLFTGFGIALAMATAAYVFAPAGRRG
jgi:predicted MFS family arabinose efflux permease